MASGFANTLGSTGGDANVLVLRGGTDTEMNSGLSQEEARDITDAPEIARDSLGSLASKELFVVVGLPKITTGTDANVPLRGMESSGLRIRENLEILEGRAFEPGRNEIMVGDGAHGQFAGLETGSELRFGETRWSVVGVFSTGGTAADSELWTDVNVLAPAYRRGGFQSVHAKLTSPEDFDAFKDRLTTDPRFNVKVVREAEYYAGQGVVLRNFISGFGVFIGFLMGIGAVFGALNTMYSAVSARTREIATLRALGFSAGPVVISVMAEALALAAMGGILGGGLAYTFFNGFRAATLNMQSFSQVAFAFAVTPALLMGGFIYALVMGFVGGAFPAIRAARLPVATALREH
jgi:putative ABC transport system permease protein